MTATRSGIPTEYAGVVFRARLEAKWAAFFDLVGWSWTYEPFDAPGYIPDFLIQGEHPFLIEVGGIATLNEYQEKAVKANGVAADLGLDILVVGTGPVVPFSSRCVGPSENLTAGWFGEYQFDRDSDYPPDRIASYAWDTGLWGKCLSCGMFGIVHSEMSYSLRPCGHHQSGSFGEPVADWLTALWRRVSNETQWAAPQSVGSILRALR